MRNQVICASIPESAARFLLKTPVGSDSPHTACRFGKVGGGLKEDAGILASKEGDVRAVWTPELSNCTGLARFSGPYGISLQVEICPNPDQSGTAREVAMRGPSTPSGFVNLMFPFRCSPAIQRANKAHPAHQTLPSPSSSDEDLGLGPNCYRRLSPSKRKFTAPPHFRVDARAHESCIHDVSRVVDEFGIRATRRLQITTHLS